MEKIRRAFFSFLLVLISCSFWFKEQKEMMMKTALCLFLALCVIVSVKAFSQDCAKVANSVCNVVYISCVQSADNAKDDCRCWGAFSDCLSSCDDLW